MATTPTSGADKSHTCCSGRTTSNSITVPFIYILFTVLCVCVGVCVVAVLKLTLVINPESKGNVQNEMCILSFVVWTVLCQVWENNPGVI